MTSDPTERFRAHLNGAGLFLDFDGTLSDIAELPHEARPVEGAKEILEHLGECCRLVAIVSGRSAAQLVDWLGPDVEIWGVHGAEVARAGVVELSDAAAPFAEPMEDAKAELSARIASLDHPGVLVEDKGVVVNVHYRTAPDKKAALDLLEPIVRAVAEAHGLDVASGRMTLELRPRAEFSKYRVVQERTRAEGLEAAAFIGDDTVDLPAFDALDELEGEGLIALRVAVRSDETPEELLRRADVVVEGTAGVLGFLREIARSPG